MIHILDLVNLSIVIWSMLSGITSGFIMSVSSFGGLIFSAYLTSNYLGDVYKVVVSFVKIDDFPYDINRKYGTYIISYLVMMFSLYFLIHIASRMLKSIFGHLMLDWVDKIFGAIFGFIRGILVSVLLISVLIFLRKFMPSLSEALDKSQSIEILPELSSIALSLLPSEVKTTILEYVK